MAKVVDWSKDIAIQLIKAGYFALAKKYHPDMGGSHDKMLALGATKEHLEELLNGKQRQSESYEDPFRSKRQKHRPPPPDSDNPTVNRYAVGWYYIADVHVIRDTDKAICFMMKDMQHLLDLRNWWLPKSQLHKSANEVWEVDDIGTVVFSEWIARQKGWI